MSGSQILTVWPCSVLLDLVTDAAASDLTPHPPGPQAQVPASHAVNPLGRQAALLRNWPLPALVEFSSQALLRLEAVQASTVVQHLEADGCHSLCCSNSQGVSKRVPQNRACNPATLLLEKIKIDLMAKEVWPTLSKLF